MGSATLLDRERGFTLVEALVAMAIFTIGFSGLYFFFGISQQVIADSEKRMYINLMGDRIVETISAQAMRASTDPLNPFVNASQYAGSLANCASYNAGDERRAWCDDLNANIGAFNAASGQEIRQVDLVNDGTGLIVNVSLVTGDGGVSAYFTRKLRKP
ncbi:type II secretion system protein [Polynucleobacter sp. MWH-UH25E]|uniref:type II secretion system protein n=1 Tax=Polynucleobacter sp. MWH-UH25E TaxID=1855616 RepID=UPI001BFEB170|nr:type II secretion system protein [Polynucleobacter sp. MWH-UH25E]QWD61793.1 type II secretion system protein [Polynucleobacter sp. MWH-UH25E]